MCSERYSSLGQGADGVVYLLGENRVAKFEKRHPSSCFFCPEGNTLHHEHAIATFLYENGVSVPQPYGVIDLVPPRLTHRLGFLLHRHLPAFVSDYIAGRPLWIHDTLEDALRAEELWREELAKISDLGIVAGDRARRNALWQPEERRVYLIDFATWRWRSELPDYLT